MSIDRKKAHPRALELAPDEFFWSNHDELGPFGSDEGDTALHDYRAFRKRQKSSTQYHCLVWAIESVSETRIAHYTRHILDEAKVRAQISDPDIDDQQYIYTVDVTAIATGFGQLVDEGKIDPECKDFIALAIERQILWTRLQPQWQHGAAYLQNLHRLSQILRDA